MKSKPLIYLYALTCLSFLTLAGHSEAIAEETEKKALQSLTFSRYPYQFNNSNNPLTAESPFLLQFSAPVDPGQAAKYFQLYNKEKKQFVKLVATRPTAEDVKRIHSRPNEAAALENLILFKPAGPLPVGFKWHLHAKLGFGSLDEKKHITESSLDYVGELYAFEFDEIETSNPYNGSLKLQIKHNKYALAKGFDEATLKDFISISPTPSNLTFTSSRRQILVNGDFDYGINYEVKIREGILANDKTQSQQFVSKEVTFIPNPGFITFPAFSSTQNASGHRKFEIKTGNLTGLRTRMKRLEGAELILALHDYDNNYEGWGGEEATPFAMAPGKTTFEKFTDPTVGVDKSESITLDWNELAEGATTGAFYLCSEGKSATRDDLAVGAQSLFQLTDIGLAWKQSGKGTLLYAFSLESGNTLPGIEIEVTTETAQSLHQTKTGVDGTATIPPGVYSDVEGTLYLDARLGNDRHVIRFHGDLSSTGLWSFSIPQRYEELVTGERRTLLFTDRNIYRPGDEVKLKAISRFVDEDSLLGAAPGTAQLRIFNSRHRKIVDREISFSELGSFDDAFKLPAAGMGWHSIEIDFNKLKEGEHPDWRLITHGSFQVEDYRVNTFEVSLGGESSYLSGEEISIPLNARYYMGKSLSKASLAWNLYSYDDFPRPKGFDEFQFGDDTQDSDNFSTDGTGQLTSKGEASIDFTLPDQGLKPAPRKVSITAEITDANQQTISNSKAFTVHSSDFYLGLRKPDGVHRAGDTATFSIAAVTTDGKAHTNPVAAKILVERELWYTVKVIGANGRPTFRNERRLETISEEDFLFTTQIETKTGLTAANPKQIQFEKAGDYLITLSGRDAQGRPVLTRSRFTVIGAEEPAWSWHDVIRIDLIPDKTTYKAGETARLLARSPVFGQALFTTERGGVRTTESIAITDYETVLEVPVDAECAPNIFASLMIIRGSGKSPHIHQSADYRLGYCQINVDDPASHLTATINTGEAKSYQPGETVEVSTTITSHDGTPVPNAEVTFFAVDEGVLSLTDHKTPDPADVFFEEFPLAVWTGQSLSDLLAENPQEQYFDNKGYVIGGGGMGDGTNPDRLRKDFKALAFWEAALNTGEDGKVTAKFVAPDNLTTFRVMAVVAQGNRFGHAEAPLVINKPLMIEPALPRFTNVTDQIDVAAIVHNNTEKRQEISLTVELDKHAVFLTKIGTPAPTNAATPSEISRTLTAFIEPGGTESFALPVALTEVGEAKWTWKVASITETQFRDATESKIQVGYPLPTLRESHSLSLLDGGENTDALSGFAPRLLEGTGEVELTLSNSRLVEAGDALGYLLNYPYGCVEQTTSSLIPWLSTQQLRPVLPDLEKTEAEVAATIETGIARLFSMQTGDGGLGYWPGSSNSVLWGSAYAGVAIAIAQRREIPVPEEQANALWNYLSDQLRKAGEIKNTYELSQRCLACYTLALAGKSESSYHEVLFQKQSELSAEARALLALALIESETQAPGRIAVLLNPDPNVPVSEVSWYKRPYIVATQLLAQTKLNANSEESGRLVTELMKLKGPRNGWGSTYSNAWPLIALAEYGEATSDQLGANDISVTMGEQTFQIQLPAKPTGKTLSIPFSSEEDPSKLTIKASHSNPVHANLIVSSRPAIMPVKPENRGFAIKRRYEKVLNDGSIAPAENIQVGDLILISLDVNIPNERESYIAIDDPLPAIFEAVNPEFKTQETKKVNTDRKARTLYTNYREIRKDRVLFFADSVYRAGDYTLQYLARVNAPGDVTAPPAKIEAMYEPQRYGLSGTESISARARNDNSGTVAAR
ncbi:alpha-2-macroglobulin family protein [Verrucomicrobiales bacterium BCK34]|nr:alpha-2-macroglobulin family protein [Verrucomicrobiales bacterium BCK34]